jgi:hypothetical protein
LILGERAWACAAEVHGSLTAAALFHPLRERGRFRRITSSKWTLAAPVSLGRLFFLCGGTLARHLRYHSASEGESKMAVHDGWAIEVSPKDGKSASEVEHFGEDLAGCIGRATAIQRGARGSTHWVNIRSPKQTTPLQRKQVEDAGFGPAFRT